jgi:hypothetical protein
MPQRNALHAPNTMSSPLRGDLQIKKLVSKF